MSTVSLVRNPTLRLNPDDDVVIAARPLAAGTRIEAEGISCADSIPAGRKWPGCDHDIIVRVQAQGRVADQGDSGHGGSQIDGVAG